MENTPQLYDTLVHVLSQPTKWLDQRHLKTLAWMMVGLMHSGGISLTAWAPYVVSRARDAQSTVRRFRRWLDNDKIEVLSLYGPLMQQALADWAGIGGFGSRAAFGSIAAGVAAVRSSASPWPGGTRVSGRRSTLPKSGMGQCIWPWRKHGKGGTLGMSSATNPRIARPFRNM